jgi:hypothetical protein
MVCGYIHVCVWITVTACGGSRCSLAPSLLYFLVERDSFISQRRSGYWRAEEMHVSIILYIESWLRDLTNERKMLKERIQKKKENNSILDVYVFPLPFILLLPHTPSN